MRLKLFIGIVFLLSIPQMTTAQVALFPAQMQSTLWTGGCYQMWRVEGSQYSISQLSFPLMLYVPFNEKLSLTVTHIPAISKWSDAYQIKGFSDTWVQGTYLAKNDKWTVNAGLGIPTGKTRLNDTEMLLAQSFLSQNIFKFKLPIYGQGFCLKTGGSYAYPITNQIILGLGAQYLIHTAYKPMSFSYTYRSQSHDYAKSGDLKYKPGNEITLQAGLDYRAGENTKIMIDGMFTHYDRDLLEKEEIYGSGMKISVNAGLYYQYEEQYVWLFMTYRLKGKHELLSGLGLEKAEKNLNGNQFEIGVVWNAIKFEQGLFYILGDGRFYSRNENDRAGASIYGGGMGLDINVAANTTMSATLRYDVGNLVDADLTRNVEGMEINAGFKIGL